MRDMRCETLTRFFLPWAFGGWGSLSFCCPAALRFYAAAQRIHQIDDFCRRALWTSAFRLTSGYGTEQPVCLAVDPVGEVQDIGAAVHASDPEVDRPEAASLLFARVDRDRAAKLPVGRVEGVDFAMEIAEVADKQMKGEPAEAWRCKSNAPRCGKAASHDYFLDESAVFFKDRHGACP